MFYGGFCAHTVVGEMFNHEFEKCAWAGSPGCSIGENHVAHHTASVRHVWQRDKSFGVGNETKLANWAHSFNGGKRLDSRESLHGKRLSNSSGHARSELRGMDSFSTNNAAIVAVEKAYKPQVGVARLLHNIMSIHLLTFSSAIFF